MTMRNMPKWIKDAVFYEIYPQSFCDSNGDGIGDLQGIIQKLDYIRDLGFNALWINPCFDSPFMDAGYDIRDYYKIAPRYGTNEDMRLLLQEAHRRGIRVLLDLVPGHTSDRCAWFEQSKQPDRNEYSDRYIWTDDAFDYPEGFRLMSGMSDRNGNYMVNFFNSQPALNYGFQKRDYPWQLPPEHPSCTATREAMKDVMRYWLDMGCDGFRVDMAYSLVKNDPDKSGTKALWQNVRDMLDSEYPEAAILSEWSVAEDAVDAGFHMDFYIHFHTAGYNALFLTDSYNYVDMGKKVDCFFSKDGKGNILDFTREFLKKYEYIRGRGYMCMPTGNHDMIRYSHHRTTEELKLVCAFLMTMPIVPFVYYGDEIGMPYREGLHSKEGGFFRTGSRTPMQWAKGKNAGFSDSETKNLYLPADENGTNVQDMLEDKDSLLNVLKRFILLRKTHADLNADGSFEIVYAQERKYPFLFRRGGLLVAVNPSGKRAEAKLPQKFTLTKLEEIGGETSVSDYKASVDALTLTVFRIEN